MVEISSTLYSSSFLRLQYHKICTPHLTWICQITCSIAMYITLSERPKPWARPTPLNLTLSGINDVTVLMDNGRHSLIPSEGLNSCPRQARRMHKISFVITKVETSSVTKPLDSTKTVQHEALEHVFSSLNITLTHLLAI